MNGMQRAEDDEGNEEMKNVCAIARVKWIYASKIQCRASQKCRHVAIESGKCEGNNE